jgi:hypothetical protein
VNTLRGAGFPFNSLKLPFPPGCRNDFLPADNVGNAFPAAHRAVRGEDEAAGEDLAFGGPEE